MAYRPERGWGFKAMSVDEPGQTALTEEVAELRRRVAQLETQAKPNGIPGGKAPVGPRTGATADLQQEVGAG
jgi:hypothetical protein